MFDNSLCPTRTTWIRVIWRELDLPPMENYHKSVRCTVVTEMATTTTNITGVDLHAGRDWTQIKLPHLSNVAVDSILIGHVEVSV